MDKKITSIVAYITIIGWLVAFLAGDKENAKFHLNQALVVMIFGVACGIVAMIAGLIPVVGGILAWVISILPTVAAIVGIIYAAQGQDKELPYIGSIKILK